jgi:hypothetical protein
MGACGEHERFGCRIPGDTCQVAAAKGLWADMVQQCPGFAVPNINIPGCKKRVGLVISQECSGQSDKHTFTSAKHELIIPASEIRMSGEVHGRFR